MTKTETKVLNLHPWDKIEIPNLSVDEQERLKRSVEKFGLKHPILALPDGRIIDGKHRYAILGGKVPADKLQILDLSEEEAEALAYSVNLDRRQLSGEQLKALMDVNRYQTTPTLRSQGMSQAQVSKITGIPQQTISRDEEKSMATNTQMGKGCHGLKPIDCRVRVDKPAQEQILERAAAGETERQIADDYKLSHQRVHDIVLKRRLEEEGAAQKVRVFKTRGERVFDEIQNFAGAKDFFASLSAFVKVLDAAYDVTAELDLSNLPTMIWQLHADATVLAEAFEQALTVEGDAQ